MGEVLGKFDLGKYDFLGTRRLGKRVVCLFWEGFVQNTGSCTKDLA